MLKIFRDKKYVLESLKKKNSEDPDQTAPKEVKGQNLYYCRTSLAETVMACIPRQFRIRS